MSLRRAIGVLLAAALSGACVPAATPQALVGTAGPPVHVTVDQVQTTVFRVVRPAGWRVVLGPADAPASVVLVPPGDAGLIFVTAGTAPTPLLDGASLRVALRRVDGVRVEGVARADAWAALAPALDVVAASLRRVDAATSPPSSALSLR